MTRAETHVSVLLPAHNAATTIARAIRGVFAQSFRDWELLVIDDGSTDTTAALAERAAGADPRVRVMRREHCGLVATLNAGLALARGRLIARMDADDEMTTDRLAAQCALLEMRPAVGVASCLVAFGGDPLSARGYALHVDWINHLREPDEIALNRFIESPVAHPSVMFRRELVERHGGYGAFDGPEDYELWLRWMDAGVRFAKVPRVLLTWHDAASRLSRCDPRYGVGAFYAVKMRYLARWLRRGLPPDRAVFLWGAGRITRQRFAALEAEGVTLAGYIDVDAKKIGRALPDGRPVLAPQQIPPGAFVIVGVGTRGARELIRAHLASRGCTEGADFIVAA